MLPKKSLQCRRIETSSNKVTGATTDLIKTNQIQLKIQMTKKHGSKGKTMAKRNFYSQMEIKGFHGIVRSLTKDALTELEGNEGGTTNRVVCPFGKIKGPSTNPNVGPIF